MKTCYIVLLNIMLLISFPLSADVSSNDTRSYELKYVDKKLNLVYKKLLSKLSPENQIKLRKAQRRWIVFRDIDCSWAYKLEPYECMIERTENRIKEFKNTNFIDVKGDYSSIEFSREKEFVFK